MKELLLDGSGWKTADDVYDAFFAAVGAPVWHGRNFNALNDSIAAGRINAIELPYRIVITNFDLICGKAMGMATDFTDLILEIAARGCPVEIELRDSHGIGMPAVHSRPKN
jgi:RNAse (barnase) inhibitor barstar